MPKRKAEPCMFCGSVECECEGSRPKKAKRRVVKKSSPESSTKQQDSASEIDFGSIPTVTSKFKDRVESTEVDSSLRSALRVLRPIVCAEDRMKIDQQLADLPQDVDRRLSEWRKRNGT